MELEEREKIYIIQRPKMHNLVHKGEMAKKKDEILISLRFL